MIPTKEIAKQIGENLQRVRKAKGYTREQIAEVDSICRGNSNRISQTEIVKFINIESLRGIIDFVDCQDDRFFCAA